jgi:hypothetical protein
MPAEIEFAQMVMDRCDGLTGLVGWVAGALRLFSSCVLQRPSPRTLIQAFD